MPSGVSEIQPRGGKKLRYATSKNRLADFAQGQYISVKRLREPRVSDGCLPERGAAAHLSSDPSERTKPRTAG
jgi:hypothetical protein